MKRDCGVWKQEGKNNCRDNTKTEVRGKEVIDHGFYDTIRPWELR